MNDSFQERPKMADPKPLETLSSAPETPLSNWSNVFLEIGALRERSRSDESAHAQSHIEEVGARIHAEVAQVEAAKERVDFEARQSALEDRRQSLREVFEGRIRQALLPLATALALHAGPAWAQQAVSEPIPSPPQLVALQPEAALVRNEAALLDLHSPRAYQSEMMKRSRQEWSPEEVALVQELQEKAWKETREWMSFSGYDAAGRFVSEIQEMGETGGWSAPKAVEITTGRTLMHTHPIELAASFGVGVSAQALRDSNKPLMMPPSIVDRSQCAQEAQGDGGVQRVVDTSGVWEYFCEAKHPLQELRDEFSTRAQDVFQRYGVSTQEGESAATRQAQENTQNPLALFTAFEPRYPGIEAEGQQILSEVLEKYGDVIGREGNLEITAKELAALSMSNGASPEALTDKVREFIQEAEKVGVHMAYTPFQSVSKQ